MDSSDTWLGFDSGAAGFFGETRFFRSLGAAARLAGARLVLGLRAGFLDVLTSPKAFLMFWTLGSEIFNALAICDPVLETPQEQLALPYSTLRHVAGLKPSVEPLLLGITNSSGMAMPIFVAKVAGLPPSIVLFKTDPLLFDFIGRSTNRFCPFTHLSK